MILLKIISSNWTNQLFHKNCTKIKLNKIIPVIYSSTQINQKNVIEKNDTNWRTIYRLPLIRWAASFNKLKFYQFGLLTLGSPLLLGLETSLKIPEQSTTIFLCAGITGLITLSLGSFVTQNLIGFIYISHDENRVRISCIDFWGRRKDFIHDVEDILNCTPSKFNLFQNIQTCDKNSPIYKLVYRFSEISDQHNFTSIFGE